ncbi:MAG: EAL domain-containing protein [Sphaerochaeta sp.]|jgi:PAS domain S-box-containing protein|nr:EAL domain-containing protein [Sphaerochaeta sp.]MCI2129001.1 EAL domain-containing protein [Sphaerochaeta sp.]
MGEVLRKGAFPVSAVVLDLLHSIDGWRNIPDQIRALVGSSCIPIIALVGEEDDVLPIIQAGASAFIRTPRDLPSLPGIVNNLHTTVATDSSIRIDRRTGLLNRETFFSLAEEMILSKPAGYYVLSCLNIDSFKVVNEQYGEERGNEVLWHVGKAFFAFVDPIGGICCRYSADKFSAIFPVSFLKSQEILQCHQKAENPPCLPSRIRIRIGRCIIDDPTLPIGNIYNRAVLAEESLHGRYDISIAQFEQSMMDDLLYEQKIVAQMHDALAGGQFAPWYQPVYNHATGALIGAEALVRWHHPTEGLIPPNRFIPAFERNGFIYEMDISVWRQVCEQLRQWIDQGRNPLPVSVNVSRIDILKQDFVSVLTGLIDQYRLPIELLRLEITESAFSQYPERITAVIRQLVEIGFTVETDDFGSGYSSLNSLKDVPVQVVKLDMRFLGDVGNTRRGGSILESVVRMVKWLDMAVIAEGVETLEQADYLKSIGCFYVQGYFYARPMTSQDYEKRFIGSSSERTLECIRTVRNLRTSSFWDPDSLDSFIFNNYLGGACILEVRGARVEVLRANDKYRQVIGTTGIAIDDALRVDWAMFMDAESRSRFFPALQRSVETGDEIGGEYQFLDLPGCAHQVFLHVSIRAIATSRERILVYCMVENTTNLHIAQQREQEITHQMGEILRNMDGGVAATTFVDGKLNYLYVNEQYHGMLGFTKEQFEQELPNGLRDLVEPSFLPQLQQAIATSEHAGIPVSIEFRARTREGRYLWLHGSGMSCIFDGIEVPVHVSVIIDITRQKEEAEQFRFLNEL